jgi:hypothetical protein
MAFVETRESSSSREASLSNPPAPHASSRWNWTTALEGPQNWSVPETELRLFKQRVEFQPREEISSIPPGVRGIYALLRKRGERFDVVCVGMARQGVKGRLRRHAQSKTKRDLWTHFSIFEVFDNVRGEEIEEREGLLRHIYRRDSRANRLNMQKAFAKLSRVHERDLASWRLERKAKRGRLPGG